MGSHATVQRAMLVLSVAVQYTATRHLAPTVERAWCTRPASSARARVGSLGLRVRLVLTSAPLHLAETAQHVLTAPTATHARARLATLVQHAL